MTTTELERPRRLLQRAGINPARATVAVLVLLALVAVLILATRPASDVPPASGAAAIVPSDALAYAHVSIDPGRAADARGLTLAEHFPDFPLARAALLSRLQALAGSQNAGSVDFAHDVRPWLGKEAAIAFLNTSGPAAGSLIVLDIANRAAAQRFLARAAPTGATSYRSTQILALGRGSDVAFISHYLAIGPLASVRAAIDAGTDSSPSLQANPAYQLASAGEPAGRVLDLYFSGAGVRRLLAPQGGIVGALGALLYQPALLGFSAAITPASGGARVRVHSALDPKLVPAHGSPPFTPSLLSDIPAGAELALDTKQLVQVAPQLFNASSASGVLAQLGPLLQKLGRALQAEGIDVQRDIVSVFREETVVAIVPHPQRPALVIVAHTPNEDQTRTAFAQLQAPLQQLFTPIGAGAGQTPLFDDRNVAGITAHQLSLGPGLELDYAVFDNKLVISTSLDGIAAVRDHKRSLPDDPRYGAALAARPERLSSLLFLDFSQLLNLGEQTGLTGGARYRALRPDLARIHAIGLSSTSGEADSTAELFLQIS
jgi:hypothetical protein